MLNGEKRHSNLSADISYFHQLINTETNTGVSEYRPLYCCRYKQSITYIKNNKNNLVQIFPPN